MPGRWFYNFGIIWLGYLSKFSHTHVQYDVNSQKVEELLGVAESIVA